MFDWLSRLGAKKETGRIYLDYAAATPVHSSVMEAMAPYFSDVFANPGAIHADGQRAREAVDAARLRIARVLSVRSEEVTFVSGGTEANNLALFGVVEAAHRAGRAYTDMEIISTQIEHPSILEALGALAERGVVVHYAPVDTEGLIDREAFDALLSARTLLVSVAYVNSEVGVVQEVKRLSRIVRKAQQGTQHILFHIDASQAPLWLPCSLEQLGVDLMTLDAGKCYGPKGVGVLAHKRHVPIVPYLYGGDQERGLRPGTENVPLVVGAAAAIERACVGHEARAKSVSALRDTFISELETTIPHVMLNGSRTHRVANNCNISIGGVDGEFAVVTLDVHGIAASTRSACAGGSGSGSHVVRTLYTDEARAASTIRCTLGEETTSRALSRAAAILRTHVATLTKS